MENDEIICLVCGEGCISNDCVRIGKKGLKSLVAASLERGDHKWKTFEEMAENNSEIVVHPTCRKNYTRKESIKSCKKSMAEKPTGSTQITPLKEKLRKDSPLFEFKEKCLLCADTIDKTFMQKEKKKSLKYREKVVIVESLEVKNSLIVAANKREDKWGKEVSKRLSNVIDLVAAEARYHHKCFIRFFTKQVETSKKKGRPEEIRIAESMEDIYKFIEESDECQFSIDELLEHVQGYIPTAKTIVSKLQAHYGDKVIIASCKKKTTVICFKGFGHKLLTSAWYENRENNEEDERLRIVKKAAQIIQEDICSQCFNLSSYEHMSNFFQEIESIIPSTLTTLVQGIIMKNKKGESDMYKLKCNAISHAIMTATRPRSFLSPLQIGLGCYIHRKFGSKILQDIMHKFGFAAPYNEIQIFEASATLQENPLILTDSFIQLIFDNADFNVNTIDGLNTFHSMGGISCITPSSNFQLPDSVERLTKLPPAKDINKQSEAKVKVFDSKFSADKGLQNLQLIEIKPTDLQSIVPNTPDALWLYAKSENISNVRGCNGFMEILTKGKDFDCSAIQFLPFLNLPPNHYDTIYSSLCTAIEKTKEVNQKCVFVTFDQPLYMKARDICAALSDMPDFKNVYVRLGGFHLLMSYLGCIGYIMAGSGLKELLSLVYAPNTVEKMLAGHAFARAVRGHTLVRLALGKIIMENITLAEAEKEHLLQYINNFQENTPIYDHILDDTTLVSLTEKIKSEVEKLEKNGPTAKLWCLYFRMITLMHKFIMAERSGNWQLHVETIRNMLPFFHASGHFPYAKACQIYLQDMTLLETKLQEPERSQFIKAGYFTVRRSEKFWSGVWTDMTIEQTLMRSMKSSGGITRGRGITDSVLEKWILGGPFLMQLSESLEELCGVRAQSSDQHFDYRDSSALRDNADIKKLDAWLEKNPPFPIISKCISIYSGIVGDHSINCYDAYSVGCKVIQKISGQKIGNLKLSRKDRVLSLATMNNSFKFKDSTVTCDPLLLFQRISISMKDQDDLETYFQYELSPYPLALFDENGMRKTTKALLYSIFEKKNDMEISSKCVSTYIIDGGWLLHRVLWPFGGTYRSVVESYISYVRRHYCDNCIIVFDGYSDEVYNTKTTERTRRYSKIVSPDIDFNEEMNVSISQEIFLSNHQNKTHLISMLMEKFIENGFETKQAEGDADTLIVNTAIEVAKSVALVAVVGDDVDLLVLLTALTPPETEIFFIKPGRGRIATTLYSSHSLNNDAVLKEHILFLHAFSGCDSTSALFGKGKMSLSKILNKGGDQNLQAASTFKSSEVSQFEISEAGKTIFIALYGGKAGISLNKHRYICFKKGVAVGKKNLSSLPPTEDAARLHSLRVYHQMQFWLGNKLLPEDWGWQNAPNLSPIPTTLPPAPKNVIDSIFCTCSKGCGKACGCRKIGLKCSDICVNCCGVSCHNAIKFEFEEEENIENIMLTASDEGIVMPEFSNDTENQLENTEGNITTKERNRDNGQTELSDEVEDVRTTRAVKRLKFE